MLLVGPGPIPQAVPPPKDPHPQNSWIALGSIIAVNINC